MRNGLPKKKNRMSSRHPIKKTNYLKTDLLKQIKKYLQPDCVRNILFVSIAKLLHLNKLPKSFISFFNKKH